LSHIATKDFSKLKDLASFLKTRIFGQDHVIDAVCDMITISVAGLRDDNKPIATFLFSGPTGVGKTELAIELANYMGIHFERFDMSEYADDSSYRNLIGGDKGLVGYEDGGLLTNAISKNPLSVLLLDEIEKADKRIYNTFLQIFDYARLTDTKGNTVDFSGTIIIMTSNLGATEQRGIGFGDNVTQSKEHAVAEFLSPEFRNRIDKIIHFYSLTKEMIIPVVDKFIGELEEKLLEKEITLTLTKAARDYLIEMGFDSQMGARSVKRAINTEFKRVLANEILYGKLNYGGEVNIDYLKQTEGFAYEFKEKNTYFPPFEELVFQIEEQECDFLGVEDAQEYAKANPGAVVVRASSGNGYIIKNRAAIH